MNKRQDNLPRTLDVPIGQTQENFMDYDLEQRKSFWYWQWQEMHCNNAPLKENKL